jgi:hypothetical protein
MLIFNQLILFYSKTKLLKKTKFNKEQQIKRVEIN